MTKKAALAALLATGLLSTVGVTGALWHSQASADTGITPAHYSVTQRLTSGDCTTEATPVTSQGERSDNPIPVPNCLNEKFKQDGVAETVLTYDTKRWGKADIKARADLWVPNGVKVEAWKGDTCSGSDTLELDGPSKSGYYTLMYYDSLYSVEGFSRSDNGVAQSADFCIKMTDQSNATAGNHPSLSGDDSDFIISSQRAEPVYEGKCSVD